MSHVNINIVKTQLTKSNMTEASTDASDIGMRARADTITLIHDGKESVFQYVRTDRDNEGDVRFWVYTYRNAHGKTFTLTVFND